MNLGVIQDAADTRILNKRNRPMRNLRATVFLSQGSLMMLTGDEIGHSQRGNNNTCYLADNERLTAGVRDNRVRFAKPGHVLFAEGLQSATGKARRK